MPATVSHENQALRIKGELIFDTVMDLLKSSQQLLAQEKGINAVDLTDVTRADSAGVAFLCELKRFKSQLQLQNISEKLQNIIELSGLSKVIM